MPTNEYYLQLRDALNETKDMKASLRHKLDQASLRLVHYEESLQALERREDQLEMEIIRIDRSRSGQWIEKKLDSWLERLKR